MEGKFSGGVPRESGTKIIFSRGLGQVFPESDSHTVRTDLPGESNKVPMGDF